MTPGANSAPAPAPASRGVRWGYGEGVGPDSWGDLAPEFEACSLGRSQSPVDIPGSAAGGPAALAASTHYAEAEATVRMFDYAVAADLAPDSQLWVSLSDRRHRLVQIHFHTPAEHAIDGFAAEAEAHLVHEGEGGALAVVGVLLRPGAPNRLVATIAGAAATLAQDPGAEPRIAMDPRDLIRSDLPAVTYEGSRTMPPCTEGVRWLVVVDPVTAAAADLVVLADLQGTNCRPVQPLNGRRIEAAAIGHAQP